MSYTMYTPLNVWLDPASVTDVVAYIQNYLSENTIYSEEEIEELIHDYLIAHPELIGGVQSVNGKTGTVVLSASDINTQNNVTIESVLASLSSQISSIASSVATNTSNITGLTGRVSTAETDISELKSNIDTSIKVYASVNEMKSDETLNVNDKAKTNGFYTSFDGGEGNYIIRDSSYGTSNNGNLIELDNGYIAELIVNDGLYNAKQFGAYGDLEHDDTSFIQLAIDNVPDGSTIIIGSHRIDGQLLLYSPNAKRVSLLGTNPIRTNDNINEKDSKLYFYNSDTINDYCIRITDGCVINIENIIIKGKDRTKGSGLYLSGGALWATNVVVQEFKKGVYCYNSHACTLQNVCITYCDECLELSHCYNFNVINSSFLNTTQNTGTSYCIKANDSSTINIQNSSLERFKDGVIIGNNSSVNCDGVYFEGLLDDQGNPQTPWACINIPSTSLTAYLSVRTSHAFLKSGCKFIYARGQRLYISSNSNKFDINEADNTTLCYDIQPLNNQYIELNIYGDFWLSTLGINTYLPNENTLGGQINVIYPVGIKDQTKIKAVQVRNVNLTSYGTYKYEDSFITPTTRIFVEHVFVSGSNVARQYTTSTQIAGTSGVYSVNIYFTKQDGSFLAAGTEVSFDILMINS